MVNETIIIVMVATYFLAGGIKGTLGIGFPTAAIALTATVVDVRTAIAFAVIPMCLINAWQIYRSGHLIDVIRANWRMVVSMITAIGLFSLIAADVPIKWLTLLVGLITSVFAIVSLARKPPTLPDKYNHVAQWAAGTVSGVLGGLVGMWAPPILVYLSARRVDKDEFVQIVGVLLFVGSCILLLGYTRTGIINSTNALPSTLLLLPAIAGFSVGEVLRKRIASDVFQKIVLVLFLGLGLNFVRRALYM